MDSGSDEQTVRTELPQWVNDAGQQNYNLATQLAGRPYTPYPNERIAGFTPDTLAGFDMVRNAGGNLGLGHGVATDAANYMRDFNTGGLGEYGYDVYKNLGNFTADQVSAGQLKDTDLSAYMNPYERTVIDQTLADLDRSNAMALNRVTSSAAAQGAYGGSAMALAQAETNRAAQDAAAREAANLRYTGYTNAQDRATADINRTLQADLANQAAGISEAGVRLNAASGMTNARNSYNNAAFQKAAGMVNAAGQMQSSGLARQERDLKQAEAMMRIGGVQQALDQQNMDLAYGDFQRQQGWPVEQLQLLSSALGGTPYGQSQTSTVPTASPLQTGLGTLAGVGGVYSLLTGNPIFGTGGLLG